MSVATSDRSGISWRALDRARQHYREEFGPHFSPEHYQDWMLHQWGIYHRFSSISIDDEKKYTMFLLRFG
jgi:hypothetical protein